MELPQGRIPPLFLSLSLYVDFINWSAHKETLGSNTSKKCLRLPVTQKPQQRAALPAARSSGTRNEKTITAITGLRQNILGESGKRRKVLTDSPLGISHTPEKKLLRGVWNVLFYTSCFIQAPSHSLQCKNLWSAFKKRQKIHKTKAKHTSSPDCRLSVSHDAAPNADCGHN